MQVPYTSFSLPGALPPLEVKRSSVRVLACASADCVQAGNQSPDEAFNRLQANVLHHYRADPDGPLLWDDACSTFREQLRRAGLDSDDVVPPPTLTYAPFPLHLLPKAVRPLVAEVAASLECDAGAVAPVVLALLGAAIGNTSRLQIKRTWVEPCILWVALVAESGFAKSPLLRSTLAPVKAQEAEAKRAYAAALEDYRKEEAEARKRKEPTPEAPERQRYRTSDATTEALVSLLARSPRGVIVIRDELAGWLKGFNRYTSGRGGDEAMWIEFHGGDASETDRKTGDERTLSVERPFVAVVGTIQPFVLAQTLTPDMVASGLAPRLLLTMPPTRALGMPDADTTEDAEALYAETFKALYAREVPTDGPELVRLSPQAEADFKAFCDANARRVDALPSGYDRAVLDKAKGVGARMALVLHLADVAPALPPDQPIPPVPSSTMRRACLLADWLSCEAVRVASVLGFGRVGIAPAVQALELLPDEWSRKEWEAAVESVRGRSVRGTASNWLNALLAAGDVERLQHGLYRAVRVSPSRRNAAFLWAGYPIAEVLGWTTGQLDNLHAPAGDGATLPTLSNCPTVQNPPPNLPPDAPF